MTQHGFSQYTTDGLENPYASLPKYMSDEDTLTIDHEGPTTEDDSTVPVLPPKNRFEQQTKQWQPPTPPTHYKPKKQYVKNRNHKAKNVKNSKQVRSTFDGEIYPPSLFQQDVPPAPTGMHGPRIYGGGLRSLSVFDVSEQTNQQPVLIQIPQSAPASMNISGQQSYLIGSVPSMSQLGPYIVPSQVAMSLTERNTNLNQLTNKTIKDAHTMHYIKTKKQQATPSATWCLLYSILLIIVIILFIGAIVAAGVLSTKHV